MKIYDISQEVFGCTVYPGDPKPTRQILASAQKGDLYNLTAFSMCAHNGTHIDAPFHFLPDGCTVEQIPLSKTVGYCFVADFNGFLTGCDVLRILKTAEALHPDAAKRILLKGCATVTEEAAKAFAAGGTELIGCESQSVGPTDSPMAVHKILLSTETVLLEGIRLQNVPEGVYFLNAAPLALGGADGAPCRAILIDFS